MRAVSFSLAVVGVVNFLQGQNVGIGTAAPHSGARLHVEGGGTRGVLLPQVALTSASTWSPVVGTPQDGMIVYNTATAGTGSDAVSPGYYYWRAGRWRRFLDRGYAGMIQGTLGGVNLTTDSPNWQYTGSYITLPPGRWIVFSTQLLRAGGPLPSDASIWVRSTFSDCSPSFCGYSPDIVGSRLISGLLPPQSWHGLLVGQVIIHNQSAGPKTYYYYAHKEGHNTTASLLNFSSGVWGENQLFALPAE